jgi:integral membrane protein
MAFFTTGKQAILKNILEMMRFIRTKVGRLRLIGFFEGVSLLVLLGVGVPMKYASDDPSLVKFLGPIHGFFFVIFVINALSVGIEYKWKFTEITWKVLLACFIPFGTFYIDYRILRRME